MASARMPPVALALGLGGLLPFLAAALSQWMPLAGLEPGAGLRGGIAYGAVVLSFLGGIRWGAALQRVLALDFALAAIPALAGWLAILLPPFMGLCLLIAGFLLQALWNVTSADAGRLPPWFGRLAMILAIGALLALFAMLMPLI